MSDILFGYAFSCFNHVNGVRRRTPEEKFKLVKESGVDGYQCDVPGEISVNDLEKLATEYGLRCLAVNDYAQSLEAFEENLSVAKRLGALIYNHHFPRLFENDIPGAVQVANRLREACADANIQYCIELHRWTLTHQIDKAYALLEAIPDISFLADFSHYIVQGTTYDQCEGLFGNVRALHLRVANTECSQPAIYEGKTIGLPEFEGMFKHLLKTGFKGPVISEMIPYYLQYPPYDLHHHNCRLINLARGWKEEAMK